MVKRFEEVLRVSLLPTKKKYVRTGVSITVDLVKDLGEVLDEVNAERDPPDRLSRDQLVQSFLEWACGQWREEKKKAKK